MAKPTVTTKIKVWTFPEGSQIEGVVNNWLADLQTNTTQAVQTIAAVATEKEFVIMAVYTS